MRTLLAEKLLVQIMEWNPEEVRIERPLLQALSNFKYDEYQQFSPGMKFIESLVGWLRQFSSLEERKMAYNFIKTQLIFISSEQVSRLVTLAYPEKVEPILIEKTADILKCCKYSIKRISTSQEFINIRRRTLFLGLSDGSNIDFFRRCNSIISNEQVYPTYYVSPEKAADMINELEKDTGERNFSTVLLIDDFTASGKSYFRKENGIRDGKIYRFLSSVFDKEKEDSGNSELIDLNNVSITVLFYIATFDAIEFIRDEIKEWQNDTANKIPITVEAIQIIKNEPKDRIIRDIKFTEFLKEYFDNSIIDRYYKKGKHEKPYLGFNECGLPLVLNHNTPNNSLPILWMQEDKKYKGLFPRITRHKE